MRRNILRLCKDFGRFPHEVEDVPLNELFEMFAECNLEYEEFEEMHRKARHG